MPVDEIAQPDSTEDAEGSVPGSTHAGISNLNFDYSPQNKTYDPSGNVDPLRDRTLETVPWATTGLPRVGVGACLSFQCPEHIKITARERGGDRETERQRDRDQSTPADGVVSL